MWELARRNEGLAPWNSAVGNEECSDSEYMLDDVPRLMTERMEGLGREETE